MVNRDLGRESQPIRSAAATGTGNEGIATLRFMRVIPGCRSVMEFRWDMACLMAVILTIPLRPCHHNRPKNRQLTTGQSLQARSAPRK